MGNERAKDMHRFQQLVTCDSTVNSTCVVQQRSPMVDCNVSGPGTNSAEQHLRGLLLSLECSAEIQLAALWEDVRGKPKHTTADCVQAEKPFDSAGLLPAANSPRGQPMHLC